MISNKFYKYLYSIINRRAIELLFNKELLLNNDTVVNIIFDISNRFKS